MKYTWMILILFSSCGPAIETVNSYNIYADTIKEAFNTMTIPCPVDAKKIKLINPEHLTINGSTKDTIILEPYKPQEIDLDEFQAKFLINDTKEHGFQFKYWVEQVVDMETHKEKQIDKGTIWMYCQDYAKYNQIEEKAPKVHTPKMITVE